MSSQLVTAPTTAAPLAKKPEEASSLPSHSDNPSPPKKMKLQPKSKLTTSIQFDITNKSALSDLSKRYNSPKPPKESMRKSSM